MRAILRRLRGIIGTGLTWAVGWAALRLGLVALAGFPLRYLGMVLLSGAFSGFIAGSAFAVILSIAERRQTLRQLSLPRVAMWGGLGGVLVSLPYLPFVFLAGAPVVTAVVGSVAVNGLMAAGFASGSVALARRADTELIEGDDEAPRLGEG